MIPDSETTIDQRWVSLLTAALVVLAATAAVPATAAANDASATEHEEAFRVEIQADGSADVTLRMTYDLADDDERAAFRSLQEDADGQAQLRDRFRERMAAVAAAAANETGREMAVTDASVAVETVAGGDVGVVELGVTWEALAAVEGDRLVVSEPFASGFEPDRRFTVTAPDGYVVDDASPSADAETETSVTWSAGTTLDGFEASFAPQETTVDGGDDSGDDGSDEANAGGQPGFGAGAALIGALLAAAMLARRRR